MTEGIIIKALSGFYYVKTTEGIIQCRARGKFRLDGTSPLVGDKVMVEHSGGNGTVSKVLERRNWFVRPAVANISLLVFVASGALPVTDPFLIDRVAVIAEESECDFLICVNKTDLAPAEELNEIYSHTPYRVIRTSTVTGEGISELRQALEGKVSAFTGNSGVGKSSLLNAIDSGLNITTAEISEKLGRGKHTTRHTELYELADNTYIADTPGYASFEIEMMKDIDKKDLQFDFPEFRPHIGNCRYSDCVHKREPGCAITGARSAGEISESRYNSYLRLFELVSQQKQW